MRWIKNWLNGKAQKVMINRVESSWRPVVSGVPQGSRLSAALFNLFINNLDEEIESTLSKFADDTELKADTPKGCAATQQDLDSLETWAERNLLRLNRGKCTVLHLVEEKLQVPVQLGT
ncbi:hypothetical protein BTVI_31662 [Pitangus sulphuratus]|nr:hypothetical protein BTVI_31662 [Pitangus sulphuratus]